MEDIRPYGVGNKKRIAAGVELENQHYVARHYFRRMPSEMAHISSREWQRLEASLKDEMRQSQEEARKAQREAALRRL